MLLKVNSPHALGTNCNKIWAKWQRCGVKPWSAPCLTCFGGVRERLKTLIEIYIYRKTGEQKWEARPANLWIPECGTSNFGMRNTKMACIAKHSKQNDKMRDIPDFRTFLLSEWGTVPRNVGHLAGLVFFMRGTDFTTVPLVPTGEFPGGPGSFVMRRSGEPVDFTDVHNV